MSNPSLLRDGQVVVPVSAIIVRHADGAGLEAVPAQLGLAVRYVWLPMQWLGSELAPILAFLPPRCCGRKRLRYLGG